MVRSSLPMLGMRGGGRSWAEKQVSSDGKREEERREPDPFRSKYFLNNNQHSGQYLLCYRANILSDFDATILELSMPSGGDNRAHASIII